MVNYKCLLHPCQNTMMKTPCIFNKAYSYGPKHMTARCQWGMGAVLVTETKPTTKRGKLGVKEKPAKDIGQFGGNKTQLLREHEIDGKKYQMWGFDTKSRSSANHYADQLRRTGKDVIVQESKTTDTAHGWMIFARTRPGRKLGSKIGSFGEKTQNGYICLHKGKQYEIYADSTFEAQKKCALEHNIKKRYEISVHLAEKNGKPVTHTADF